MERNEIERIAKLLMETPTVERIDMHPKAFVKFLSMYSPRHVEDATYWSINLKTGKMTTRKENPLTSFEGMNEPAFNPTGYWMPRIRVLAAVSYIRNGIPVLPSASIVSHVARALKADDNRTEVIVT